MSSVLQQLLPLLGVLIGGLLSYFVSTRVERAKWRRERSSRWDGARMDAYATYAKIIKEYTQVATRIVASRGLSSSEKPLTPEEGLPILAELEVERGTRWEAVLLLGDADTIAAARSWHESVWKLDWFARGDLRSRTVWDDVWAQTTRDRARFYECARYSLEISQGGAASKSGWHRKVAVWEELSQRDRVALAGTTSPDEESTTAIPHQK